MYGLMPEEGKHVKIHIVQKGDTLWKIAKKYGADFNELKKLNAQLSNPDMIMPGMKIKVPTSGGTVKKEFSQGKKEYSHGKKEVPKAVPPFQQMPTPTMPVQKEVIKEKPVKEHVVHQKETIYKPVMPKPVVPEIDINNYYLTNMTEIEQNTQIAPPPPVKHEVPVQPIYYKDECESSSSSGEMYTMPIQEECYEGMYPNFYPPVAPMPMHDCGCGGPAPFPPAFPHHQMPYAGPMQMPFHQAPFPAPMPPVEPMPTYQAPVWQGYNQPVPQHGVWVGEEESSSSSSSSVPFVQHQGEYHHPQQSYVPQQMPMTGFSQHPQGFAGNPDGAGQYVPQYGMQQPYQAQAPYQNMYGQPVEQQQPQMMPQQMQPQQMQPQQMQQPYGYGTQTYRHPYQPNPYYQAPEED